MRPSWVEVDLGAIVDNLRNLKELVAPAQVWAVVKADGYGHGDVPVAEAAIDAGVDGLCVALVEEGVRLREAGIDRPILLLSEPAFEDVPELIHWRITPTVYRLAMLEALVDIGSVPTGIHLKVDTGMHRVGAGAEETITLARRARACGVEVAGLWTHLAVAETDDDYTTVQVGRFDQTAAAVAAAGIGGLITHVCNTAGAILHSEARADAVRIGLGMYGLYPSEACRRLVELRPALRLISHVSLTRRVAAGEAPSYGRRRPLAKDATVATIPIGYADGVPRLLSDAGAVLIGGRRHPFAGSVTMDQIVVDVGDSEVAVGDEVVLIGDQGGDEIGADEWAAKTGTISYEIVARIGSRLPRRYLG